MQITKALLADYANIAEGGKLNVLGIFAQINALAFPCAHPQMCLILMWEANRSESGRKKVMEVDLCDEDGKKLGSISGEIILPAGVAGKKITGNHIIVLNGIVFPKDGEYVFNVLVDGDHKAEAPFEVVARQGRVA